MKFHPSNKNSTPKIKIPPPEQKSTPQNLILRGGIFEKCAPQNSGKVCPQNQEFHPKNQEIHPKNLILWGGIEGLGRVRIRDNCAPKNFTPRLHPKIKSSPPKTKKVFPNHSESKVSSQNQKVCFLNPSFTHFSFFIVFSQVFIYLL